MFGVVQANLQADASFKLSDKKEWALTSFSLKVTATSEVLSTFAAKASEAIVEAMLAHINKGPFELAWDTAKGIFKKSMQELLKPLKITLVEVTQPLAPSPTPWAQTLRLS